MHKMPHIHSHVRLDIAQKLPQLRTHYQESLFRHVRQSAVHEKTIVRLSIVVIVLGKISIDVRETARHDDLYHEHYNKHMK